MSQTRYYGRPPNVPWIPLIVSIVIGILTWWALPVSAPAAFLVGVVIATVCFLLFTRLP